MSSSLFFEVALKQATRAAAHQEVPIGAVLVKDGKVIARAHNQTEMKKSFLAHAEMIVLERGVRRLGSKFLKGCELYVTLEPCTMCLTAMQLSRVDAVHYLLPSKKFGSEGPGYRKIPRRQHDSSLSRHAHLLLQDFIRKKR